MGREKEALIEAEDNFQMAHSCGFCGISVPLAEADVFFETGRCGRCEHILSKDD